MERARVLGTSQQRQGMPNHTSRKPLRAESGLVLFASSTNAHSAQAGGPGPPEGVGELAELVDGMAKAGASSPHTRSPQLALISCWALRASGRRSLHFQQRTSARFGPGRAHAWRSGASTHPSGAPGARENRRAGQREDAGSEWRTFALARKWRLRPDPPRQPCHCGPGDNCGAVAARHGPASA